MRQGTVRQETTISKLWALQKNTDIRSGYHRIEFYRKVNLNEKSDQYDTSSEEESRELWSNSDVLATDNQALVLIRQYQDLKGQ